MGKVVIALLIGICAGFGVTLWQRSGGEGIASDFAGSDQSPFERGLTELTTSLQLDDNERHAHSGESTSVRRSIPDSVSRSPEELDQFFRQQQLDRFVAAGLAIDRAHAIMQREDEIEMDVLRARHAATQSGSTPEQVAEITPLVLLRNELGDSDYAKYLNARGRETSINVRGVLAGSPAETAGLRGGDEIVAYNGQRVFNMSELTELTYEATAGVTVPLEVIRDGRSIQLSVEGGPIGISVSGRP